MKNQKNKVILVAYLGRRGGGAAYSYEMTRGLINNGYTVRALISDELNNKSAWYQIGLETIDELKIGDSILKMACNTVRFLTVTCIRIRSDYSNVDAVYIPMIHPWIRFLASALQSKQIIFTMHDPKPHSTSSIFKWIVERTLLSQKNFKIDDAVILSGTFKDYVSKEYNLPLSKIHVIPHGPFDVYKDVDDGSVYEYTGRNNFLFLGTVKKYKGLDVLAAAYSILSRKIDGCTLTIAGSGDFTPYEALYNGLNNVNVINEWIPDSKILSFFRCESKLVLVVPYIDATQSGVIPIAMENGVPVVASNTGGISEQVEGGKSGILFEAGNPESLALAMIKSVMEDTSVIVENAKKHMSDINWDNLGRQLGEIVR